MKPDFQLLNLNAIQNAMVNEEPYPYMVIDNLLNPEMVPDLLKDFPAIHQRGSFPLSALNYSGYFAQLVQELEQVQLKQIIGTKFGMDLHDKPTLITLRGQANERDGKIHVDSTSKLITLLLYLNQSWEFEQTSAGCLRLLYNSHDLNHYAAEIPPLAGRCVIFKVTPNCWHGHETFIGTRRSLQLNYVHNEKARDHHLKRHRISAFFKELFHKENANSTY